MNVRRTATLIAVLFLSSSAFAQTQTNGRIAGTLKDQDGALIAGAEVITTSKATGEERKVTSDDAGSYSVPFLPPDEYRLRRSGNGSASKVFGDIALSRTGTATRRHAVPG